jgi:hypothetical protein
MEQDSSASSGSTEMMLGIGVSGGVILIECRISKALVNQIAGSVSNPQTSG